MCSYVPIFCKIRKSKNCSCCFTERSTIKLYKQQSSEFLSISHLFSLHGLAINLSSKKQKQKKKIVWASESQHLDLQSRFSYTASSRLPGINARLSLWRNKRLFQKVGVTPLNSSFFLVTSTRRSRSSLHTPFPKWWDPKYMVNERIHQLSYTKPAIWTSLNCPWRKLHAELQGEGCWSFRHVWILAQYTSEFAGLLCGRSQIMSVL